MDVNDGHSTTEDRDGQDYENDAVARAAAIEAARALIAGSALRGRCRHHWRFDVRDAERVMLFQIPFGQALSPDRMRPTQR